MVDKKENTDETRRNEARKKKKAERKLVGPDLSPRL